MDTDKNVEIFIQKLKNIRLSERSAADMRERLIAYADLHEVPGRRAVLSPYYFYRFGAVGALVVLLLVGGTSVSLAANSALPGQALYGVKVNVNEPLAEALIPTTQGKATYENVLAERRLTEASTLAAQNKLTDQTRTYLEQQVVTDTEKSQQGATTLQDSGNDAAALAVRSDLEARLSAHADLLAVIEPRLAAAGDSQESGEVAALFQKVEQEQQTATQARVQTDLAISEAPEVKSAAASHQTAAEQHTVVPQVTTNAAKPSAITPASAVAIVQNDDRERTIETQTLFEKHVASLLSLLPATTTASTTASTTTATSTLLATSTVSKDSSK